MRNYLTIILCLLQIVLMAQIEDDSQDLYQRVSYPIAPETAAYIKYGNIPMNLSQGMPDVNIPLYTIETQSGLNVPIYLSYNAFGVKIDEVATNVGLGWTLHTGGNIVIERRGLPDNLYPRKFPYNSSDLEESVRNFTGVSEILKNCNININRNIKDIEYLNSLFGYNIYHVSYESTAPPLISYDREPDMYYYSYPNGSGTFVLDSKNTIIQIKQTPLIIQSLGLGFKIIDNLKNIYDYSTVSGGREVLPKRQFKSEQVIADRYNDDVRKLSKIETKYGEILNFIYINEKFKIKNSIDETSYTLLPGHNSSNIDYIEQDQTYTAISNQNIKAIKKDKLNVSFVYSGEEGLSITDGSFYRKDVIGEARALKRILVTYDGKVIKSIDLEYDYFLSKGPNSANPDNYRLKLVSVQENNDKIYKFSYYGDGENFQIPERLSNKHDAWGYFSNTYGSIPALVYGDMILEGNSLNVNDDYKRRGSLREIIYPTKGSTEFYYNEKKYNEFREVKKLSYPNLVYRVTQEGIRIQGIDLPPHSGTLKVNLINNCKNENPRSLLGGYCSFKVLDEKKQLIQSYTKNDDEFFRKDLSNAVYLESEYFPGTDIHGNNIGGCECAINFIGKKVDIVEENVQIQTEGLRLDKLIDYTNSGQKIEKTYLYLTKDGIYSRESVKPVYFQIIDYTDYYHGGAAELLNKPTSIRHHYIQRSLQPYSNRKSSFKFVRENSNGGSTLYEFSPINESSTTFPPIHKMDNLLGGELLNKYIYNSADELVKHEEFNYTLNYDKNLKLPDHIGSDPALATFIFDIIPNGDKTFFLCPWDTYISPTAYRYVANYNTSIYPIKSGWVQKSSQKTKVLFRNSNSSIRDSLITQQIFSYDNIDHMQLTKLEMINTVKDVQVKKISYPHDLKSQGIQPQEMERLISENRIGEPVMTETFVNDKKISSTITKFGEFNGGELLLPHEVYTAKGEVAIDNFDLENRKISYDKYDSRGNILQYTMENGIPISVIWGYGEQYPIAKIEGIAYDIIDEGFINELKYLSNLDNTTSVGITGNDPESRLRKRLHEFQTNGLFKNAMVTTYTYDPLIGVTSITPPTGQTAYYQYDAMGRLESIKDEAGNTLQDIEYNYKN